MARLPDLVRDSKLETRFLPDFSVETVHIYHWHEAKPAQRRPVSLSEHWKRQRRIGSGGYSSVWLESCREVSRYGVKLRAVKQIETGGRFSRIDFNRELEAIAKFSHPKYERCFVKSFGWYNTPENLLIAMEYMELGDLHDYLLDRPALPETQVQDISYQILEGLQMMHENQFIHRDLKPRNILIKSYPPQEWWVKIGDFGISKRMEESPETSTTLRGTMGFIAPELYGFVNPGSPYSTDIWSFGEIIFQMLTKKPVFKPISQLSSYIRHPETFPNTALIDADVTPSGIGFIQSLMEPKPVDRLTTEMALGHMWIQLASETASTPRTNPLGVEGHPIQTEKEKQRAGSSDEINGSSPETLRPRSKTSSVGPRATTTETTGLDRKANTGGSETLRPKVDRKTDGVRAKYAYVEDYDSNEDTKKLESLSSGTVSDSSESDSERVQVFIRTKEPQSSPPSEGSSRGSEHSRSPEPKVANDRPKKNLSFRGHFRMLEREKKEKARASRDSSSTGNTLRIKIRSVEPAKMPKSGHLDNQNVRYSKEIRPQDSPYSQTRPNSRRSDHLTPSAEPSTRRAKSSSRSRDRNIKAHDEAQTSTPRHRSRDRSQHSEERKSWPRRGKTRIPRELVHVHAILDLGYPFREDQESYTIQRALSKDQIDELMTLSRSYEREPGPDYNGRYIGSDAGSTGSTPEPRIIPRYTIDPMIKEIVPRWERDNVKD